jgi:hypothetical protein
MPAAELVATSTMVLPQAIRERRPFAEEVVGAYPARRGAV